MMAELYGRQTGHCKGKGGSMHIAGFGHRHARRQWDRRGLNGGLAIAEAGPRFLLSQSRLSSYHWRMTKLLEQAVEAVRRLPLDSQDDIARTILQLAGSEVEAEPEFATYDEVEDAFRR
jgi:hypothetical protein